MLGSLPSDSTMKSSTVGDSAEIFVRHNVERIDTINYVCEERTAANIRAVYASGILDEFFKSPTPKRLVLRRQIDRVTPVILEEIPMGVNEPWTCRAREILRAKERNHWQVLLGVQQNNVGLDTIDQNPVGGH